jgi:GTP-binding protein
MDIRHPCKDTDVAMVRWALAADLAVMVLLSKSDKLKQGQKSKTVRQVKQQLKALNERGAELHITPFSSLKGEGLVQLQTFMTSIYEKKPDINKDVG